MTKHKYSTITLIIILTILIGAYAIAELDTNDLDSICNENNATLKRTSNNWNCHTTSFGELYYHNHVTPLTVTLNTVNITENVTGLTTGICVGTTCTSNEITTTKSTYYKVTGEISFDGGNNQDYELELAVNDQDTEKCEFYRTMGSTGTIGVGAFSCIIYCTAGDELHIKARSKTTPVVDIDIYHLNLNIMEIK